MNESGLKVVSTYLPYYYYFYLHLKWVKFNASTTHHTVIVSFTDSCSLHCYFKMVIYIFSRAVRAVLMKKILLWWCCWIIFIIVSFGSETINCAGRRSNHYVFSGLVIFCWWHELQSSEPDCTNGSFICIHPVGCVFVALTKNKY